MLPQFLYSDDIYTEVPVRQGAFLVAYFNEKDQENGDKTLFVCDAEDNKWNSCGRADGGGLKHLKDGLKDGALRGVNTIEESEDSEGYQVGENSMVIGENSMCSGDFSLVAGKDNISQAKGSLVVGELNRSNAQFGNMFGSNNTSYGEYNFVTGVDNVTHSRFDAIFGAGNVLYQAYPYDDSWGLNKGYNNIFGMSNAIDGVRLANIFGASNSITVSNKQAQYFRIFGAHNNITGSGYGDIVDVTGHDNDFGESGTGGYLFIRGTKNEAKNSGQFLFLDGADNIIGGAGGYEYIRGTKDIIQNCGQSIYLDGINLRAYNNSCYSQMQGTSGILSNSVWVFARGCCLGMNAVYDSSINDVKLITDYTPSSLSYSFFEGDKIIVDNGGHNLYARGVNITFTRNLIDGTIDNSSPGYVFIQGDAITLRGRLHNIYAQGVNHQIEQSSYAHIFGTGHRVQSMIFENAVFGVNNNLSNFKEYSTSSIYVAPQSNIIFGEGNTFENITPSSSIIGGSKSVYKAKPNIISNYFNSFINTSNSTLNRGNVSNSLLLGYDISIGDESTSSYMAQINNSSVLFGKTSMFAGTIAGSYVSLQESYNGPSSFRGYANQSVIIGDSMTIGQGSNINHTFFSGHYQEFTKSTDYSYINCTGITFNDTIRSSVVQGVNGTMNYVEYSVISLYGSSIEGSVYRSFLGLTNTGTKYITESLVIGNSWSFNGGIEKSIIIGSSQSLAGSVYNSIVQGNNHYFEENSTWIGNSFISGCYNKIAGSFNMTLGCYNSNTNSYSVAFGNHNTTNDIYSYIDGYGNIINASAYGCGFIHGKSNTINSSSHSTIFGSNVTINGGDTNFIIGHSVSIYDNSTKMLFIGCNASFYNSINSFATGCNISAKLNNSILSGTEYSLSQVQLSNSLMTGMRHSGDDNIYVNNSLIFGMQHSLHTSCYEALIGGFGNTYASQDYSVDTVIGNYITIKCRSSYNAIFGNYTSFNSGSEQGSYPTYLTGNIIAGNGNNNSDYKEYIGSNLNILYNAIFGNNNRIGYTMYNLIAGNYNRVERAFASGIIGNSNYYKTMSSGSSDGSFVEGNVNHVEDSYCNHVEGEGNYVNNSQLTHNEGIGSMKVTVSEYVSSEPEIESSEEPVYKYFIEGTIDGYTYLDFHKLFGVGSHIVDTEHTPSYSLTDQVIGVERRMIGSTLKYIYTLSGPITTGVKYVSGMTSAIASHIEGGGNNIYWSRHVHIEGIGNISYQAEFSHIEGSGNTDYSKYSHIGGYLNYIGATGGEVNFIHGKDVNYNSEYGSYGTFIGCNGVYTEGLYPTVIGSEKISIEGNSDKVAVIASDNINIDETNKKNIVILGMSDVDDTENLRSNTVYVENIEIRSLTNAAIDALFASL